MMPMISAVAVPITVAIATPISPSPMFKKITSNMTSTTPMIANMTIDAFALPSSLKKLNGKYIRVVKKPNTSII